MTDLGHSQAVAVGIKLNNFSWKRVYSSDLLRAIHTSTIMLSHSTVTSAPVLEQILHSEWLREINFGVREGLPRSLNAREAKIEYAKRNNLNAEDVVDSAETLEDVRKRQLNFILNLLEDHLKDTQMLSNCNSSSAISISPVDSLAEIRHTILCMSHGGYIKQFLKNFCGVTAEKIGNCAVSEITVEWLDTSKPQDFTCTAEPNRINMHCDQLVHICPIPL